MITGHTLDRNIIFALQNPMTPQRIKRIRRQRFVKRLSVAALIVAMTACAVIG